MGALCGCCVDRKPRMPMADWDKLKEANDEISGENDMRAPPPKNIKSTSNVKTPLLADDTNTNKNGSTIRANGKKKYSNDTDDPNARASIMPANLDKFREFRAISDRHGPEKLRTIALKMRETVEIKDRKFHLKVYSQCFVASEMVTKLLVLGFAETEEEAIEIGMGMHYFKFIQHVTDQNKLFKNKKDRFWIFMDEIDKIPVETNNNHNNEIMASNGNDTDLNGNSGDKKNQSETSELDEMRQQNRNGTESSELLDKFADPSMSMRSDSAGIDEEFAEEMASELSQTMSTQMLEETEELVKYRDIRDQMIKFLDLKERKWMLKVYKECALASDVCKVLIRDMRVANNNNEAVQIGQVCLCVFVCIF